ncbi:hypothetical protein BU17DRAFT_58799, partial [Hysterangium stoloniferum]
GMGIKIAMGLAQAGFGTSLGNVIRMYSPMQLESFLPGWHKSLVDELWTNKSGRLPHKYPQLSKTLPTRFPEMTILELYSNPLTSERYDQSLQGFATLWTKAADIGKLSHFCELYFDWGHEHTILEKFRTLLWPGILIQGLMKSPSPCLNVSELLTPQYDNIDSTLRIQQFKNCLL